jgi:hypothetical protein
MKCRNCGLTPKKFWEPGYCSLLCFRLKTGIIKSVDYSHGRDKTVEVTAVREGDVVKVLAIREITETELAELAEQKGRL